MSENTPTLRNAFKGIDPGLEDRSTPGRRDLDEKIRPELPGFEWVAAKHDLVAKLNEVLDLGIPDILIGFWKKSDEIEAALKESTDSPGEPVDLVLCDHTLSGSLHPKIEVRIGKTPQIKAFEIPLTLDLECKVEEVTLGIRDGAITHIALGKCTLEGTLKLKDLVLATAPPEKQESVIFRGLSLEVRPSAPGSDT